MLSDAHGERTTDTDDLTYDKWIKWYREAWFSGERGRPEYTPEQWEDWLNNHERDAADLLLNFNWIVQSQTLKENFLRYPLNLQIRICDQVWGETPLEDIETSTDLCLRLQKECGNITDWFVGSPSELLATILNVVEPLSDEFRFEADNFPLNYPNRDLSGDSWTYIQIVTPALLLMLHDEAKITEVLKILREKSIVCSIATVVELVDRWEELKQYPIEWSLGILSSNGEDHD